MILDLPNKSDGPLNFHDAVFERLSSKQDVSAEQLILEELKNKAQSYTKDNPNVEDSIVIYYYTFLSDFIKHKKKYALTHKANALYNLFKEVIDQDLRQQNSKIPGLFQKDKQLLETLLNDFTNAKQLNIKEECIFSVLLKYVSASMDVEMDTLFKKFTQIFLTTLLERKGALVKKALNFLTQFMSMKSTKNSATLKECVTRETIHVLETFKINANKTYSALAVVPVIFDSIERKDRSAIHRHLNAIIGANVDKQLKIKTLNLLEELCETYSLDMDCLENTLECFTSLREEGLFLMLDKNFVKVFLKCYLSVFISINKLDNSKGRKHFTTLLSLSLDILFETDNLEKEFKKQTPEQDENPTAARNKYRLKRDITNIVCSLIENAIDIDMVKFNVDENADLEDLIASIDLKNNYSGLDTKSVINRVMALIVYTLNDNFTPYFNYIDRIIRCFINQLDNIKALDSSNDMIKTFGVLLYEKIKGNPAYENSEGLIAFLLEKIDYLFVWVSAKMDKNLQNEDFTYLLLLIQKHCTRVKFNALGEYLFDLAHDLIYGAINANNENAIVLNLIKSLGKFKRFDKSDLRNAETLITKLQTIIFDKSISEELKRPFVDILQNFLMFCSEHKSALKRDFFEMLVRKSKDEIFFGNICKELLETKNQALQICYENIIKLLAFLLPDDYIVPMLVNNIRQIISKLYSFTELPKEMKIVIIALDATPELHSHINLFEASTDLVNEILKSKTNISAAIKLLTSISHNVNESYFMKVQIMFDQALKIAQEVKDLSALKASLRFIKDVIEKNQNDQQGSQKAEEFLENYLDFVFSNFKNRNAKTRMIVREIIFESFSKYSSINETNRLFAIILSGLDGVKNKSNYVEVLNYVLKKRYADIEPLLKKNIIEVLVFLMSDLDKSVITALLKAIKTLAKLAEENTVRSYLRFFLDALNEHHSDLISNYREKIKKIFQILIRRFVS